MNRMESRDEASALLGGTVRAQAATNRVPCLVLLSEQYGDRVFPLPKTVTTIGRSIERDVLIDDPQISKKHAEILRRPDGSFLLRDAGSRNGTRVNGAVASERTLKPGDRIELGGAVTLYFTDKQIASDTTKRDAKGATGEAGPASTGAIGLAQAAPHSGGHTFSTTTRMPIPQREAWPVEARAPKGPAIEFAGRRLSLPHEEVAAVTIDLRPARVAGRLDEASLTLLYQIAEAFGAARTEAELFERVVDLTSALIPADHVYLFLPAGDVDPAAPPAPGATEARSGLRMVASRPRDAVAAASGVPASRTIVEQVLLDRTAIATTDAAADERFREAESVVRNRIRAVMAAPLVVGGRATGVLYLDHEAAGYLFNRAELNLLTAIAFHAGHALASARARDVLERRVAERTQEIRRISIERAELLAMAAHDLKTPLAGLVGYLECLGERALVEAAPAWVGEELSVLTDAGRSMMSLLCDLLDGQRAEAGRIEVAKERTDLTPFLRETVRVYERWALGAGRRVVLAVAEPLPVASIDRRRVTQILNNLVHNGLKYTPRGGAVRIEVRSAGARRIEVSVTDEGQGFNPSDSDRILLSFERGTSKEPARGEGHGLGLSIVKKLITLLEGELVIDGRPGRGARFAFTLPC